ncbi:MAG: hypothetical protein ACI4VI_05235 [Acutalibacteraceae bacterium]
MKRIISIVLALMLFAFPLAPFSQAADGLTQTEYFEDGSYMVIGLDENIEHEDEENSLSFMGKLIEVFKRIISLFFGKSYDKTAKGEKYIHYYDKNGVRLWSVYLEGEFTYNGKSATCTDACVKYYIYDDDWEMLYCKAEKSGATATSNFKVRQYKLGVPLKAIERTISLTCDKDGKIK